MSTDNTTKSKVRGNDTFERFDNAISGKDGSGQSPARASKNRTSSAGFLLRSILRINRFFSQNHSALTKNISIFGLVIGLITIVQTQRQIATSQNNFKTEVEIQTKSTSALLINDYLNELNASNFQNSDMTPAEEEFLGAKTRFLLNGISHSTLRAEVLTFMGSTPLRSFISATPREMPSGQKQLKLLVSLAGVSFDEGVISGAFPNGNFTLASLRKARLDDINIPGATLHYTDLREAVVTGGDYSDTHFVCSTLANAIFLQTLPDFSNVTLRMTDLRGLKFSDHVVSKTKSTTSAALLANILNESNIDSVLVDKEVYEHLSSDQQEFASISEESHADWISKVISTKHCDSLELAAAEARPHETISMLNVD